MVRLRSLGIALLLCLLVPPVMAQEGKYGETEFENSGAVEAQDSFLRGLLMLHSFEYDDARTAFQKAQEIDPDFAMAHWGEAMTHNHPIWMEQDRSAAIDALEELAATPEKQLEKAPTEREKAYLRTLHVLYGAGTDDPKDKEARDDAYADAMGDLAERYPEDLDAQAFHALSILGTAHEGREFDIYMRAAAIVEEVFDANPQHPGAAHYLIHAYDDPVHAPLGLRPARVYADIAPAAPHALHMPSHIFFSLGMWDQGARSNVDSYEAADAKSKKASSGLSGGGFHALHWLHYARLQQGRHEEARSVLETTRMHATESTVSTGYADYMRWYMPVAYVVETEHWTDLDPLLDEMNVNVDSLDSRAAVTVSVGKGFAAAHTGDLSAATSALDAAQSALGEDADEDLQIQVQELRGLIAWKEGNAEKGLDHLEAAAALEAEKSLEFGPPFPPKPAHELYGEALLSLDRPSEALTQFTETLNRYPGRALALVGKAQAAAQAGQTEAAREANATIADQWAEADDGVKQQLESVSATRTRAAPEGK